MAKDELRLNLGIDFGTAYTKVCLWGDDDPDRSLLINLGGENYNLGMFPDGVHFDKKNKYLKMQLNELSSKEISLNNKKEIKGHFDQKKVREIENLCAYFVATVIVKSKQVFENSKEGKKRLINKKVKWTANLGVPVKYADSPVLAYFHRVLHLALAISENNLDDITTETQLKKVLEQPRKDYLQKFNLSQNLEEMELKEIQEFVKKTREKEEENVVLAELEAAIRPLDNVDGIYFVVDIGAGTVDASSCLIRTKGEIDYFYTSLEEIGVATLSISEKETFSNQILDKIEAISAKFLEPGQGDFRANKHLVSANSIIKELESKTSSNKDLLELILFQQKLHQQIGDLVMETKNENPGIKKTQENDTLKFVLIGGGSRSKLYEDTIFATHKAFKQESASIPKYDVKKFTNPNKNSREKGLVMGDIPEQYFDRYLVAYGLSIPGKSKISKSSKKYLEGFNSNNKSSNKNDIPKQEFWERANIGTGKLS